MLPRPVAPLARSSFDRAAERRPVLAGHPNAGDLVLLVDEDRVPVERRHPDAHVDGAAIEPDRLRWAAAGAEEVTGRTGTFAFLGQGPDGTDRWALVRGAADAWPASDASAAEWMTLRVAGARVADHDAGALVAAVSLGRWLRDDRYCPRCGAQARITTAGWARHCDTCDREIFPRTDPAVIVAVTDQTHERLLLGSHVAWGQGRYSCFAGFVEAGESLEATVVREVREEAGVDVGELSYVGSQAWPYPRSLMVGFEAVVTGGVPEPDGEEIVDVRWWTRSEIGAALRGETSLRLPGETSIARMLVENWYRGAP